MNLRILLSLLLALAASPVEAGELTLYTAKTTGMLTVGPDGRVLDVELDGVRSLGEEVIAGYEAKIRDWTFEPVLENGQPVAARATMTLSLLAARESDSESATFGIRNVWFGDKASERESSPAQRVTMKPPRYPQDALYAGVGAEVMLLVELAPDGSVARAGVEEFTVLGMDSGDPPPRILRGLARAAEKSAEDWRIPEYAGRQVRVPVSFSPSRGGWEILSPYAWQPDPWVTATKAQSAAIAALSASGESSRLTLLSELPKLPGQDG